MKPIGLSIGVLMLFSAQAIAQKSPWHVAAIETSVVSTNALTAEINLQSVILSSRVHFGRRGPFSGYFQLERSADGRNWRSVSCTPFAATSRAAKPFRYVDKLTPGEGYYRLVLVTENDMVQELAQTTIPTPSGAPPLAALADYELRVVKLSYMAPVDRHLLLRIYNHIGEQLFTTSLPVGKSSVPHSYALDFAPYPNGTYLLVITQVEDNVDIADHRVEWALPG